MKTITMAVISVLALGAMAWAAEGDAMTKNIAWLGHDTFRVTNGGTVIYTDPFQLKSADKADIVLITHEHRDHCSVEDLAKVLTHDTVIVTTAGCAAKIGQGNFRIVKPGDKLKVAGVEIEAVAAYNTNKQFHPMDNAWVGFIFKADGHRIYLAGDTDRIPQMKDYRCDIALLPVGGTYTMTAEEAAEAALDIKPRLAIPMHFGSIVGTLDDAERFRSLLKGKVDVTILTSK